MGWTNPIAWLGTAVGLGSSLLFSVALLPTFGGGSHGTQDLYAELGARMAAIGRPLDATAGPVITNFPIWMAETQRIPSLALPDEPPEDVLDLARTFPGTRLMVLISPEGKHWPADLEAGLPGSECFQPVDLGPPSSGPRARTSSRTCSSTRSSARDRPLYSGADGGCTRRDRARDSRFEGLHAEASAAVGYSANTIRAGARALSRGVRRGAGRWQELVTSSTASTGPRRRRPRRHADPAGRWTRDGPMPRPTAGASDAQLRALRGEVDTVAQELEGHRSTWPGSSSPSARCRAPGCSWSAATHPRRARQRTGAGDDVAMRIVEAQEAERARLAQEIHDGPAQALSNAIFQADYTERMSATDPRDRRGDPDPARPAPSRARQPARLHQPAPAARARRARARRRDRGRGRPSAAATALQVTTDLRAPNDALDDHQQTVALRVTQEALQNVRKHAAASTVVVSTDVADDAWTLEIRDDGRGFDVGAVAARGRRNFGLQFMRERAELIDARFDVRSRADGGTVVRLAIPTGARTGEKENG